MKNSHSTFIQKADFSDLLPQGRKTVGKGCVLVAGSYRFRLLRNQSEGPHMSFRYFLFSLYWKHINMQLAWAGTALAYIIPLIYGFPWTLCQNLLIKGGLLGMLGAPDPSVPAPSGRGQAYPQLQAETSVSALKRLRLTTAFLFPLWDGGQRGKKKDIQQQKNALHVPRVSKETPLLINVPSCVSRCVQSWSSAWVWINAA